MEKEAFLILAETRKARLFGTARLYLGSDSQAVDAVDEAVYKGFLSCHKLRQDAFAATWLTRILINVCNKELRRRKREITLAQAPEPSAETLDHLPLKEAISALSTELRAVIALRYFSGLTLDETAKVLDLPVGTVSTRQRKALALLRLELGEEEQS